MDVKYLRGLRTTLSRGYNNLLGLPEQNTTDLVA